MKCTNCGSEVPETAKVCGHCGHRLKAAPVSIATPPPVTPAKRGLQGWAWGLIGAVAFLCILVAVLNFFIQQNKGVAEVLDTPVVTSTVMPPLSTEQISTTGPAPVTDSEWEVIFEDDFSDQENKEYQMVMEGGGYTKYQIGPELSGAFKVEYDFRFLETSDTFEGFHSIELITAYPEIPSMEYAQLSIILYANGEYEVSVVSLDSTSFEVVTGEYIAERQVTPLLTTKIGETNHLVIENIPEGLISITLNGENLFYVFSWIIDSAKSSLTWGVANNIAVGFDNVNIALKR